MIIKICGITSVEIAEKVKEFGADLIGFVFADSKRRIKVEQAMMIGQQVKGIGKVGVFVNSPLKEVQEIAQYCQLDFVQLHGEESPEYCHSIGRPYIKAFRLGPDFDSRLLDAYHADWILVDSFSPGQYGGTGITFDWQAIQGLSRQMRTPLLVAGGLTPLNIEAAIRTLSPGGVDVSGGVETNGKKDIAKIRDFIIAARRAEGGNL
jgi:phosphoribosylanthranilate isomerase